MTGEVFRSRWTVRRSRGKVSGSLQKVEMTLTNLTSGVEQQGTKTELLSRISELIGLSFEQFNRSVLLAQGDFATFLKARQPDKAEILEKLTGTEIYSRISASIYERTKRAESEYKLLQERIKGIELLTDEQLQQLSAEKEELQVRLSVSKKKEGRGELPAVVSPPPRGTAAPPGRRTGPDTAHGTAPVPPPPPPAGWAAGPGGHRDRASNPPGRPAGYPGL